MTCIYGVAMYVCGDCIDAYGLTFDRAMSCVAACEICGALRATGLESACVDNRSAALRVGASTARAVTRGANAADVAATAYALCRVICERGNALGNADYPKHKFSAAQRLPCPVCAIRYDAESATRRYENCGNGMTRKLKSDLKK